MSAPNNRQRVLNAALKLFNRDGLLNVRLQHISDESIVSVGNMAYHFKNKDAIVQALWAELVQQQRILLQEFRVLPLFEDTERLMRAMFELQQSYLFFYLDTLEIMRAYPDIRSEYQEHLHWQAQQMETMIRFNVSRGAFTEEPEDGFFARLAAQFWMSADLWVYRQMICQSPPDDYFLFRKTLWSLFLPLCTEMGKKEFVQINAMALENLL